MSGPGRQDVTRWWSNCTVWDFITSAELKEIRKGTLASRMSTGLRAAGCEDASSSEPELCSDPVTGSGMDREHLLSAPRRQGTAVTEVRAFRWLPFS
jgi:hypothetical protein